jgi:hypothetical protein
MDGVTIFTAMFALMMGGCALMCLVADALAWIERRWGR